MTRPWTLALLCALLAGRAAADAPVASYLFPAGGRRGTDVEVRVGGLCLYDRCHWELSGPGVTAGKQLVRTNTLWLEGPILPLPDSQRQENYPQDMLGKVSVAGDAAPGIRRARLWTSEGADGALGFMVGDLPEVVERETADPRPVEVTLPVTVNGRVFPREDVDVWTFAAKKGRAYACEVFAARLGSPLDSRLEVRDPDGQVVAENDDARGADSFLRFVADRDGRYSVRIHDSQRGGSQAHVYRLTVSDGPYVEAVYPLGAKKGTKTRFALTGANVPDSVEAAFDDPGVRMRPFAAVKTNAVTLDVGELPEALEAEPNDEPARAAKVELPCFLNGRIDRPGDVDCFSFAAKKGQSLELTSRSQALGSPVAGVVEILDDGGKALTRAQPRFAELTFAVPRDGTYVVRIGDQFRTRGGPAFAYRLRLREAVPDFRLSPAGPTAAVVRGEKAVLRVKVERSGGFDGPVALSVEGLPRGVEAKATTAGAGQAQIDVPLTCAKDAPVAVGRVRVTGSATLGGQPATRAAVYQAAAEDWPLDEVLLAAALRAPFKLVGEYDLRLAARGTVFRKKFKLERNGFVGPVEVRLADKQARHLQGVTGPTLALRPEQSEFEYPVTLPPWMETGRTSRACVMAVGRVTVDGVEHVVSHSSQDQKDQIIAVVETGQLGLELGRASVAVKAGAAADLPVSVRRGKGLAGPVKVEVVLPDAGRGLSASAVTIAAGQTDGTLRLRAGDRPVTTAVLIRATLETKAGPVTAEARAEVVAEPAK